MSLSKVRRAELREMFGGKCAYCGCVLPEKGWHADHIKAINRELKFATHKDGHTIMVATGRLRSPQNDTAKNLFPACAACNIDKGSQSLDDWRGGLENLPALCRKYYANFRHAERFGLVQQVGAKVVFYFETFQGAGL